MTSRIFGVVVVLAVWVFPSSALAQSGRATFTAVGDLFFGRAGNEYGTEDPFRYVSGEFRDRDIVMGNLETPITAERVRMLERPCSWKKNTCDTPEKHKKNRLYYLTFQGRPETSSILAKAGFTVLCTANNHSEDQGQDGLLETRRRLVNEGLESVGTGASMEEAFAPLIVEKNGVKVGIVARTNIWNFDPQQKRAFVAAEKLSRSVERLPQVVRELKTRVDFVVVTMHYGTESIHKVSRMERKLMGALSEAGADVFIGHHPHVLRGIEMIGKMVVFWSLGNFLFDASKGAWGESGMANIEFVVDGEDKRMENVAFTPVTLNAPPDNLPRPASARRSKDIIRKVMKLSGSFSGHRKYLRPTPTEIRLELGDSTRHH